MLTADDLCWQSCALFTPPSVETGEGTIDEAIRLIFERDWNRSDMTSIRGARAVAVLGRIDAAGMLGLRRLIRCGVASSAIEDYR